MLDSSLPFKISLCDCDCLPIKRRFSRSDTQTVSAPPLLTRRVIAYSYFRATPRGADELQEIFISISKPDVNNSTTYTCGSTYNLAIGSRYNIVEQSQATQIFSIFGNYLKLSDVRRLTSAALPYLFLAPFP
jgi:hypothetical protein